MRNKKGDQEQRPRRSPGPDEVLALRAAVAQVRAMPAAAAALDGGRRARLVSAARAAVGARRRVNWFPVYAAAAFYPPNLWANGPMKSKGEIQEALARVIERKVGDGTFMAPAD